MFQQELEKLDLPKDLVLTLENISVEESAKLMSSADIVVATGGPSMVKAAYSSGKPSLGVGQGNVQCIIDEDVDLADAAATVLSASANRPYLFLAKNMMHLLRKSKITVVSI